MLFAKCENTAVDGSDKRTRLLEKQTLDQLDCFCRQLSASAIFAGLPNQSSQSTNCGDSGIGHEHLAQAIIVGGRGRFGVIETADFEEPAGIVIAPDGFTGLFRERADLLFDQTVGLDSLWKECKLDSVREASNPSEKPLPRKR